ncbi:MAG: hypothetical protein HC899_16675 [Leptolyngbyaceae cyanobacterium SM1_4_3]|nr:hypothetical protein [Leptolyngbyaceae cyanobacterium SM1_4_3]
MGNVPVLKPHEVVRILESLGFVEVRQKGCACGYAVSSCQSNAHAVSLSLWGVGDLHKNKVPFFQGTAPPRLEKWDLK